MCFSAPSNPSEGCGYFCFAQVMVFVHARNETVRTATVLCEMAKNEGDITSFQVDQTPKYGEALKQVIGHWNE